MVGKSANNAVCTDPPLIATGSSGAHFPFHNRSVQPINTEQHCSESNVAQTNAILRCQHLNMKSSGCQ